MPSLRFLIGAQALQYLLTGREGDVLLGPLLCVLLRALVTDKGAFRTLAGAHPPTNSSFILLFGDFKAGFPLVSLIN